MDPRAGRWLNRDPLGEAAGLNMYAYVGNNPINLNDPSGQCPPLLLAIPMVIGAAAGLGLSYYLASNGYVTSPCAQGFLVLGLTLGGAVVGLGVGVALTAAAPFIIAAAPVLVYTGPYIERFVGRITNTGG